jgi:hypothetical protein
MMIVIFGNLRRIFGRLAKIRLISVQGLHALSGLIFFVVRT